MVLPDRIELSTSPLPRGHFAIDPKQLLAAVHVFSTKTAVWGLAPHHMHPTP